MFKLCKWIWAKAEESVRKEILDDISSASQYHRSRAEVAFYKDKAGIKDSDDVKEMLPYKYTPQQHSAIASAMNELYDRVAPPQEAQE